MRLIAFGKSELLELLHSAADWEFVGDNFPYDQRISRQGKCRTLLDLRECI
ncbi:MAG: hypothetical protein R2881_02500 [Eubacteriales bacterium]